MQLAEKSSRFYGRTTLIKDTPLLALNAAQNEKKAVTVSPPAASSKLTAADFSETAQNNSDESDN